MPVSRTQLLLVEEFSHQRQTGASGVLDELREQLSEIIGTSIVEVTAQGRSSALATLPVGSDLERDRIRDLINERLNGWKVVEAQQYGLPQTF